MTPEERKEAEEKFKAQILEMLSNDIKNLENCIAWRDNDDSWLSQMREHDTNEYYWKWGGEHDIYDGRLEAIEKLKQKVEGL